MNIFRFAHPDYLYALAVVPLIILLFILMNIGKRRAMKRMGEMELMSRLSSGASKGKAVLKLILFCLAFSLIVTGLANPQIGTKLEEVKRAGVDVIIALDVSNSMLAEDIKPNRLERAKQAISRFIDKLENDRIGLIVFAGKAYVQLPITTDFGAAKLFLSTISTNMVPTQGTAIGDAIELATKSFVGNENKHKVLVIITDGENHEDDPISAAKKANEEGVVIHTIGMGSVEGAPIPIYRNGQQVDFLKDQNGIVVVTRIDQATLEQIAAEGKGVFIRASTGDDGLDTILKEIGKMDKKTFESKQFTDYEDRFQYFIGAGLLLLLLEFMISYRRNRWIEKFKKAIAGKHALLLLFGMLILGISTAMGQGDIKFIRQGNRNYKDKKYGDAEVNYRKALDKNQKSKVAVFNLGNALYRQGKFEEAVQQFQAIAQDKELKTDDRANAFYNMGNAYFKIYFVNDSLIKAAEEEAAQLKDVNGADISDRVTNYLTRDSLLNQQNILEKEKESALNKAIDAFKNTLRLEETDEDARYNLAYAQKLIRELEEKKNKNKKEEKKEPTAFALGLKKKADELITQKKYEEAYVLMSEGAQKDATVKNFNDYINKLKDVIVINKLK